MQPLRYQVAVREPSQYNGRHHARQPGSARTTTRAVAVQGRRPPGTNPAAVGTAVLISLACGIFVAAVVTLIYRAGAHLILGHGG
jgi:hypothetical protein